MLNVSERIEQEVLKYGAFKRNRILILLGEVEIGRIYHSSNTVPSLTGLFSFNGFYCVAVPVGSLIEVKVLPEPIVITEV